MEREPVDESSVARLLGSDVPIRDAGAKERARLRLRRHIAEPASAPAPPSAGRRRPWRWLGVAAAFAAGVMVVQALLPQGAGGPTSARATLRRLAAVASTAPPQEVGLGEFVYSSSRELRTSSYEDLASGLEWTFQVSIDREVWVGADGSGRIVTSYGEPVFPSDADEAAWREAGSPPLLPEGAQADGTFGPGELTFYGAGTLPTDVDQLAALVESRKILDRPPGDAQSLNIVGSLLAETYASPQTRAVLLQVAAGLPGVELLGQTSDPLGRPGIAVGITEAGIRTELIFDEGTADLLALERVDVGGEGPSTLDWRAYLASEVVGSVRERP